MRLRILDTECVVYDSQERGVTMILINPLWTNPLPLGTTKCEGAAGAVPAAARVTPLEHDLMHTHFLLNVDQVVEKFSQL